MAITSYLARHKHYIRVAVPVVASTDFTSRTESNLNFKVEVPPEFSQYVEVVRYDENGVRGEMGEIRICKDCIYRFHLKKVFVQKAEVPHEIFLWCGEGKEWEVLICCFRVELNSNDSLDLAFNGIDVAFLNSVFGIPLSLLFHIQNILIIKISNIYTPSYTQQDPK